jgi:hypothetical protein
VEPTPQEQRERQERLDASSAAMKASAEGMARQFSVHAPGENEGPVQWGELGLGNGEEPLGFAERKSPDYPGELVGLSRDCSSEGQRALMEQAGVRFNP